MRQMEAFKSTIQDCNLLDVPFMGPKFTWFRGKGFEMILERLDRGLANARWFNMYPGACEQHLITTRSDHAPFLFCLKAYN